MNRQQITSSLVLLGKYLSQHSGRERNDSTDLELLNEKHFEAFEEVIQTEHIHNPWFTEEYTRMAIDALAASLYEEAIQEWLSRYPELPVSETETRTIGIVLAGNIPLVGFHDMICVISSGHRFLGKPSSKDDRLIKEVAKVLKSIDPVFEEKISFTSEQLSDVDAMIATGSNNSARYFEYYFQKYPHIIRKNRTGVAVLTGDESEASLDKLGNDVFSYFGMGCRNVTKIFVPESYNLTRLMKSFDRFDYLSHHHKYINNIEYNRAMYLMNRQDFLDNGVILLKENPAFSSPVGVVYYEKYSELESVIERLAIHSEEIQCVVSESDIFDKKILPGETQQPKLWDYADGVDTMIFLTDLSK